MQNAASPFQSDGGPRQKKKGSTTAGAVPDQDLQPLPDQATEEDEKQRSAGPNAVMDQANMSGPQKKTGRKSMPVQAVKSTEKSLAHKEALPDQVKAVEQKKTSRSTRTRRLPDQVMVDAVISDTEAEEEEETASDTDFVAIGKGSKKVCDVVHVVSMLFDSPLCRRLDYMAHRHANVRGNEMYTHKCMREEAHVNAPGFLVHATAT